MYGYLDAHDIEIAVAAFFKTRQKIILPNASWGLVGLGHECDMLIVDPKTKYAEEIEIKISASDLKKDAQKKHGHRSILLRKLWFAVPDVLSASPHIPDHAGIIAIKFKPVLGKNKYYEFCAIVVRKPKINKFAIPLTDKQIIKIGHLACMRLWNLKKKECNKRLYKLAGVF